jgi:preprotein translocase subunit SecE
VGTEVKSMELKKNQQIIEAEQALSTKKVEGFVADVKSEIHKITWTSRDELKTYTKIVVCATLLFGMSIYFLDLMIQGFLGGLGLILRWIGG